VHNKQEKEEVPIENDILFVLVNITKGGAPPQ
jgi:hypothetical protein